MEGEQRELVGGLGAIEKMLLIIKDKLHVGICDDVMETAWSTMWNVTDETPSNCLRDRVTKVHPVKCTNVQPAVVNKQAILLEL